MRLPLFLGVFALVLAPLSAQDSSSDFEALAGTSSDESAASAGELQWSGDQAFAWRWGATEDPTRTGGAVDSTLSATYDVGDLKVLGTATVRNNEFVPGETVLQWAPSFAKLVVGLQEFSWGVADARNPTDTLNARDYLYGADSPRLVNPAASLTLYPVEWLSVEAVYEPWKERTEFPKDFEASTQKGLDDARAAMVANGLSSVLTNYHPTATADPLERSFDRPVYGGRANVYLPGVDLSFSYLNDWDTYYTPVVTLQAIDASGIGQGTWYLPSEVDLVLNRIQRFGVNAKTTVDRFGLWLEAAYNLTEDHAGTKDGVRNDKISWTTGFDANFGPASAYYINLQYAGEWTLGYDDATLADYTADPTTAQLQDRDYMLKRTYRSLTQSIGAESEALLNTVTYNVKFPLADSLVTPSFSGAVLLPLGYDNTVQTRVASAFFKPEIDVMPADGVHVLFGADLSYGWVKKAGSSAIVQDTTTDKLGVYTPQNNVYLKVQYKWNGSLGL